MIEFRDNNLPTVVVITRDRWNNVPRIRQQVTRQLTRFFNVIYLEKYIGIKGYEYKDRLEKNNDRLIVYTPTFPIPSRLYWNDPITHHFVNVYLKIKLSKLLKLLSVNKSVLLNFDFDLPEIYSSKIFCYKIYLCNDEFPKMLSRSKYKYKLFQYYENRVSRAADKCLAVSYPLLNKLIKINGNTELFLPGHEFKISTTSFNKNNREARIIKVGFMGYIDFTLDTRLFIKLSKERDIFLYLIGPIINFDTKIFSDCTNISFLPAMTGDLLYDKLLDMDVLIIPYDTRQKVIVNTVTAPNKLFQYLAAGKPIVISDMPNFIELPYGVIYKSNSPEVFIEKIRLAVKEDNEDFINTRLNIARENTWDVRGNALKVMIETYTNDKHD